MRWAVVANIGWVIVALGGLWYFCSVQLVRIALLEQRQAAIVQIIQQSQQRQVEDASTNR